MRIGDHTLRLATAVVLVAVAAAAAVSLTVVSPMLAHPPSPRPVTASLSPSLPSRSPTSSITSAPSAPTPETGVVSYVVDGDTIEVRSAAGTTRVRVLGINAPEIAHDGNPAQCYGPEAITRARAVARGKPVTLTSDPTQPATDRYGRQLRYVDAAGGDLGQLLLAGGFAYEYHLTSQGPTQRTGSYLTTQDAARSQQAGLWGACPSHVTQPRDHPSLP